MRLRSRLPRHRGHTAAVAHTCIVVARVHAAHFGLKIHLLDRLALLAAVYHVDRLLTLHVWHTWLMLMLVRVGRH